MPICGGLRVFSLYEFMDDNQSFNNPSGGLDPRFVLQNLGRLPRDLQNQILEEVAQGILGQPIESRTTSSGLMVITARTESIEESYAQVETMDGSTLVDTEQSLLPLERTYEGTPQPDAPAQRSLIEWRSQATGDRLNALIRPEVLAGTISSDPSQQQQSLAISQSPHPGTDQYPGLPEYLKPENAFLAKTQEYQDAFIEVPRGKELNRNRRIPKNATFIGSVNEDTNGIYLRVLIPGKSKNKPSTICHYELVCRNELDLNFDKGIEDILAGRPVESFITKMKKREQRADGTYKRRKYISYKLGKHEVKNKGERTERIYTVIWYPEPLLRPREDAMKKAWTAEQAKALKSEADTKLSQEILKKPKMSSQHLLSGFRERAQDLRHSQARTR
jgi:hypothetical protein